MRPLPAQRLVLLLALLLAIVGSVLVVTPAQAAVTIPQSELNGAWFYRFCDYGRGDCASFLQNSRFIEHGGKDCRGGRIAHTQVPVNPTSGVTYRGNLSTFRNGEVVNGRRVCEARSIPYEYTFTYSPDRSYVWIEVYEVGLPTTTTYRHEVGDRRAICRNDSVTRQFESQLQPPLPTAVMFSIQFTSLSYCFDGSRVWFQDDPEQRVIVAGDFTSSLQGACIGVSRTAAERRLTNVYVTCNAGFSHRYGRDRTVTARNDANGASRFVLPLNLNIGFNLGTAGFIGAGPTPDQMRYYTLRLYSNGCYGVSGVGDTRQYC